MVLISPSLPRLDDLSDFSDKFRSLSIASDLKSSSAHIFSNENQENSSEDEEGTEIAEIRSRSGSYRRRGTPADEDELFSTPSSKKLANYLLRQGGSHEKFDESPANDANMGKEGASGVIASLQIQCQRILCRSIHFKNVLSGYIFAERYNSPLLAKYCLEFINL